MCEREHDGQNLGGQMNKTEY